MPIRYEGETIHMEGFCAIDEAEELLRFLELHRGAQVVLTECQHLHTALLQLLLSYRVCLAGEAYNPFVSKWIVPMLRAHGG
jgi:hypothetical protein